MQLIKDILSTSITLHLYCVVLIAIAYLLVHCNRHNPSFAILAFLLNYIPVLTTAFGHIFFYKVGGGRTQKLLLSFITTWRCPRKEKR
ncbi:hypothetical protein ACEE31_12505, partial [Staphylococcus simulans]